DLLSYSVEAPAVSSAQSREDGGETERGSVREDIKKNDSQDRDPGLTVSLSFFSFLSACWPAQLQSRRTQNPVMADWLPAPSQSNISSSTKKESLCLLCVPTMSWRHGAPPDPADLQNGRSGGDYSLEMEAWLKIDVVATPPAYLPERVRRMEEMLRSHAVRIANPFCVGRPACALFGGTPHGLKIKVLKVIACGRGIHSRRLSLSHSASCLTPEARQTPLCVPASEDVTGRSDPVPFSRACSAPEGSRCVRCVSASERCLTPGSSRVLRPRRRALSWTSHVFGVEILAECLSPARVSRPFTPVLCFPVPKLARRLIGWTVWWRRDLAE
ncbi:unnamed protein product, partial [Pleuronectes platessa]